MLTGVILANTGTPDAPEPDAVERYLSDYLMDPRIRQMPKFAWSYLLKHHILPKRKFSSAEKYQIIWTEEGSPLVRDQLKLADLVQGLFDTQDQGSMLVRAAMSYGHPNVLEILEDLRAAGCERIILVPTYPQSAYAPTRAVVERFERLLAQMGWNPETVVVDNYHDEPLYIAAIARQLRDAGFDPYAGDTVMWSMHSIPLKDVEGGDTYLNQIERSVSLVAEELGVPRESFTVSFQSVFGHKPEQWAGPQSRDLLADMRESSRNRVLFICPGFAIDCLETLYDIPYEMCPALEGEGVRPQDAHRFVWVKCLGPTEEHAALLKRVIEKAIGS